MQPAFAGDEPERVEFPTSYFRLPSPGGQELITQKESPPYLHMKDFIEDHLDLLQQKTANALRRKAVLCLALPTPSATSFGSISR